MQLLVLQHPLEVGHAKNTARLLHQCVAGSRLEVGEVFAAADLQQWLHAPWPGQAADAPVHTALLYPATAPDPQLPLLAPPALPGAWLAQPQQLRLVVLDGTWRKSRKMLYLNPALQTLPRVALQDVGDSGYAIRKAHLPGQLSSFEAAVLGLAQLQNWPLDAAAPAALNQVFAQFVARQILLQNANQVPVRAPDDVGKAQE